VDLVLTTSTVTHAFALVATQVQTARLILMSAVVRRVLMVFVSTASMPIRVTALLRGMDLAVTSMDSAFQVRVRYLTSLIAL
jgi:hypothetical protein